MTRRSDWTELPVNVRDAIESLTGTIGDVRPAATGNHADITATVYGRDGATFVKAARKVEYRDGPEVRSLRWEAAINPYVPRLAPRLLWQVEAGGWLALGFEHVHARTADYSPGSPDLPILAKTIRDLHQTPCPDVVNVRVEHRWENLAADVSAMAGNALLHTDLNADNLLITPDRRCYVVDWAFTSRGAGWVELSHLALWLIKAGHTPQQADEWMSQFPIWLDTDPAAIDLHAQLSAELWRRRSHNHPASWVPEHTALVRQWADHRKGLP